MKPQSAVAPIVHPLPASVIPELRRWRLEAAQRHVALSRERYLPKGKPSNVGTIPQHNEEASR
jgi:hypothetical protein